ncbi:L-piperidine-6-carboxylate dehydrogenase [Rhodococcus sp. SJ-3]|uniref:L-piperidine-6-carboxylate dehydrogenase n=1 Tax=Rhodococcus sp. SJ-3 TaxID=3454628 RepID=UPI003F79E59A
MNATDTFSNRARTAVQKCGATLPDGDGALAATTPIDGTELAQLEPHTAAQIDAAIHAAADAFEQWRNVPAPVRGRLVRRFGDLLVEHKHDLAEIVTLEVGKIPSEALGEVQEMIDVCDFAVGLSRQLYGRTMPSERPGHRLMETWHPLGVVGVISAFNFPVAVWSWNTAIALVCGNPVVWKPSETTPLTALACDALLRRAAADVDAPPGLHHVLLGDATAGEALVDDPRIALVSATGSVRMGRIVAPRVAARFGRCLLELSGNNAAIVTASADLELTVRGVVFASAGTAGQRCTTLRRLIVHRSVIDNLVERLATVYRGLRVGNPFDEGVLVGPLISSHAYDAMRSALDRAELDGGILVAGGQRVQVQGDGVYVSPALLRMPTQTDVVREETFAPVLYVLPYDDFDEAIALHNNVPQGLSSSIFTTDQREAERFLARSDCGIANVNIGTSGAEIGGAFGGEKETGGGRESGSDSWKAYMRRATNTVNYSDGLPLAQGVEFG